MTIIAKTNIKNNILKTNNYNSRKIFKFVNSMTGVFKSHFYTGGIILKSFSNTLLKIILNSTTLSIKQPKPYYQNNFNYLNFKNNTNYINNIFIKNNFAYINNKNNFLTLIVLLLKTQIIPTQYSQTILISLSKTIPITLILKRTLTIL